MQAEHQLTSLTRCTQLSDSFGPPAFTHKASLFLLSGCIYRHSKRLNVRQEFEVPDQIEPFCQTVLAALHITVVLWAA